MQTQEGGRCWWEAGHTSAFRQNKSSHDTPQKSFKWMRIQVGCRVNRASRAKLIASSSGKTCQVGSKVHRAKHVKLNAKFIGQNMQSPRHTVRQTDIKTQKESQPIKHANNRCAGRQPGTKTNKQTAIKTNTQPVSKRTDGMADIQTYSK